MIILIYIFSLRTLHEFVSKLVNLNVSNFSQSFAVLDYLCLIGHKPPEYAKIQNTF